MTNALSVIDLANLALVTGGAGDPAADAAAAVAPCIALNRLADSIPFGSYSQVGVRSAATNCFLAAGATLGGATSVTFMTPSK